eukprot:1328890-Prymnesium_polylepis.1
MADLGTMNYPSSWGTVYQAVGNQYTSGNALYTIASFVWFGGAARRCFGLSQLQLRWGRVCMDEGIIRAP